MNIGALMTQILRDHRKLVDFVRFLAVGGLNTLFGYSFYALLIWLGLQPEIALLIATVTAVMFNFITYGRLAFGMPLEGPNLVRFIATYATLYAVNAALLRLLITLEVSPYLAQIILTPLMSLCSFTSMRYFVFRAHRPS